MVMNIPMPGAPGESFLKGIDSGSNMFARLMQPIIQRENMARQWQQHQDNLGIQQQQQDRLQQTFDQHQADKAMLHGLIYGSKNPPANGQPPNLGQTQVPTELYGQSKGMFTDEGLQDAQQEALQQQNLPVHTDDTGGYTADGINYAQNQNAPNVNQQNTQDPNLDAIMESPILRGMFKNEYGFDLAAQTPKQKQEMELDTDLKKLKQKHDMDIETADEQKTLTHYELLPDLSDQMNQIMDVSKLVKSNPDIFGHPNEDKYLKTSDNPNAGRLTVEMLPTIMALEKALSTRGSQLALQTSKGKVPNVSDSHTVAMGKTRALLDQKQRDILQAIRASGKRAEQGTITGYMNGKSGQIPYTEAAQFVKDGGKLYDL